MQVLFIAAHLGGGAGKAIVGMCNYVCRREIETVVLALEETDNKTYLNQLDKKVELIVDNEAQLIQQLCCKADIIIINWWAHPLMFPVLLLLEPIPVRVVLWSHINGCGYPALESRFLLMFHRVLFTCVYSYENKLLHESIEQIRDISSVIYGIGEFEPKTLCYKSSYQVKGNYKVGYLGTLDYTKLNRSFISICENVANVISNVEFVLYGECSEEVQEDISKSCIKEKFVINGYTDNPNQSLMAMDILAYPLNSVTSGTTENVLLEAMAAGVPIVALNQGTEKYIIQNNENGILADCVQDVPEKILQLLENEYLRERLGEKAREDILAEYCGDNNADRFVAEIEKVLKQKKRYVKFSKYIKDTPYEWFLSCCGIYKNAIDKFIIAGDADELQKCKDIIGNKSKSSARQFFKYYADDRELGKICEKL